MSTLKTVIPNLMFISYILILWPVSCFCMTEDRCHVENNYFGLLRPSNLKIKKWEIILCVIKNVPYYYVYIFWVINMLLETFLHS